LLIDLLLLIPGWCCPLRFVGGGGETQALNFLLPSWSGKFPTCGFEKKEKFLDLASQEIAKESQENLRRNLPTGRDSDSGKLPASCPPNNQ
jgi:hypothetical protein